MRIKYGDENTPIRRKAFGGNGGKEPTEAYREDAIKAAKDFRYGDDVIEALKEAKTIGQMEKIMVTARHKMFG